MAGAARGGVTGVVEDGFLEGTGGTWGGVTGVVEEFLKGTGGFVAIDGETLEGKASIFVFAEAGSLVPSDDGSEVMAGFTKMIQIKSELTIQRKLKI